MLTETRLSELDSAVFTEYYSVLKLLIVPYVLIICL